MNKVTTISLNGNAFQLEEEGCVRLSAYLTQASARLAGNPDQAEITADLEQAIADKFRRFLSAHKSVITTAEVDTTIREMGPVSGGTEQTSEEPPSSTKSGPKRLYRISEGKILGGVATGLAAYFDVDVMLIRLAMIILLICTGGGFAFGYLLACLFIPSAVTQEQQAAASGAPFNAEEIIARTKAAVAQGHAEGMKHWQSWKQERRAEQARARESAYAYKHQGRSFQRHASWLGELVGVIVFTFFAWYGYHHFPMVHDFLTAVWNLVHHLSDQLAQFIVSKDRG